jgi:hypothetical protein
MDDEPIAAKRAFNTVLRFWTACPTAPCRRHRRCAGDPDRCRTIFWPEVSDETKTWWGAFKQAQRDGQSLAATTRAADDAVVRWRQWKAQRAQTQA